jgi:hypothetical protein
MDLFTEWDDDGNGTISRLEFRGALAILGLNACEPVANSIAQHSRT